MARKSLLLGIVLVALLAAWSLDLGMMPQAQAAGPQRTSPDLFYNYYVPPGYCGGVGAQLYVAPRPVPPLVGHTYVTYQPLMPHEFLYPHCRKYLRCNPDGGWTRTVVSWHHDPFLFDWLKKGPKPIPSPRLPDCFSRNLDFPR